MKDNGSTSPPNKGSRHQLTTSAGHQLTKSAGTASYEKEWRSGEGIERERARNFTYTTVVINDMSLIIDDNLIDEFDLSLIILMYL